MAGKIFINYRRGDDPGNTGRLFDRLQDVFPPEQLFLDVDNIAPGLDFVHVLNERVAECDILLAVIGKGWIDARDATGNRRLADPDDFVRIEIESALNQEKRVIPVLVGEAQMPRPEDLPPPLRPLARRNAVRLTHERFRADTQGLVKALQQALEEIDARQRRQAEAEAEQRAQEQRRLQDEAARRTEEEERRRKVDAESRNRAEEEREFSAAKRANTVAALDAFLAAHGDSSFAAEAQKIKTTLLAHEEARQGAEAENRRQDAEAKRLAEVQRAFTVAKRADTVSAIEAFELTYAQSAFAEEAKQHKAALLAREEGRQRAADEHRRQEAAAKQRTKESRAFARAKRTGTVFALDSFLAVYPASSHTEEAQSLKAALLTREETYRRAAASDDAAALSSFLTTYKRGADVDQVRARLRQLRPRQSWELAKPAILIPAVLAVVVLGAAALWLESRPAKLSAPAVSAASTASTRQTSATTPIPGPDEVAWTLIKDSKFTDQLQRFIAEFPNSAHRPEAEQRIASLAYDAQKSVPLNPANPYELARSLQFELQRVGCFVGTVNGELDDATKAAWQHFIKITSINAPDAASPDAINAVRSIDKRVCPLICPTGEHVEGEVCAVDAPPLQKQAAAPAEPAAPVITHPAGGGGGGGGGWRCHQAGGAGGGGGKHPLPGGGCGY
jgi:TIR domain-containing protein